MKTIFPKKSNKTREPLGKTSPASRFSGTTTYIHVRNTKFVFNNDVSINAKSLMIRATPFDPNNFYDLDDIYSHAYNIIGGEGVIDFDVLGNILNKYVLNFRGAPLRNLSFSTFLDEDNNRRLMLKGEMRIATWLPFAMTCTITLEKMNGSIVITADEIKAMGFTAANKFMNFLGVSLKHLIRLPKGLPVSIQENSIVIQPLLLFPPPKLTGRVSDIKLEKKYFRIFFEELEHVSVPQRPIPTAINDFFLFGGDVKIAQSRYIDMHIQILDRDPKGVFEWHVKNYFKHIRTSIIGFPAVNEITISTLSYPRL